MFVLRGNDRMLRPLECQFVVASDPRSVNDNTLQVALPCAFPGTLTARL